MVGRTDWRGTAFGIFVGVAVTGIGLISPSRTISAALISIGITGAVISAVHRIVPPKTTIAAGVITFALLGTLEYYFGHHVWPTETVEGPRFEFQGIKTTRANGYITPIIEVGNTSDIAATSYILIASIFASSFENNKDNREVADVVDEMEARARKTILHPTEGLQITRGTTMELNTKPISEDELELVNTGRSKMYIVMVVKYISEKGPIHYTWITEVCRLITKPFTDFESCPSHNRYFLSDERLNPIN